MRHPAHEPISKPAPARRLSPGQAWRLKRDAVIAAASTLGFSQRTLAEVFDLPHSRVAAIIKEARSRYGRPDPD